MHSLTCGVCSNLLCVLFFVEICQCWENQMKNKRISSIYSFHRNNKIQSMKKHFIIQIGFIENIHLLWVLVFLFSYSFRTADNMLSTQSTQFNLKHLVRTMNGNIIIYQSTPLFSFNRLHISHSIDDYCMQKWFKSFNINNKNNNSGIVFWMKWTTPNVNDANLRDRRI